MPLFIYLSDCLVEHISNMSYMYDLILVLTYYLGELEGLYPFEIPPYKHLCASFNKTLSFASEANFSPKQKRAARHKRFCLESFVLSFGTMPNTSY